MRWCQPGGQVGNTAILTQYNGQEDRRTTRLTGLTLHHLASLDQTEEGPVGGRDPGRGLQYSAGGRFAPSTAPWVGRVRLIRHHTEYGQSGQRVQMKKPAGAGRGFCVIKALTRRVCQPGGPTREAFFPSLDLVGFVPLW